jgi:hypothetical protein
MVPRRGNLFQCGGAFGDAIPQFALAEADI